jgi:hypothetical protein
MRRNLLLTVAGTALAAALITGVFVALNNARNNGEAVAATAPANQMTALPGTDRAVFVQAVTGPGGLGLSVSVGGKVGSFPVIGNSGERELFVLSPIKDRTYLIKTAYARVNGKPSCLTARAGRVFTNACDPNEWAQTVQLMPPGSPTFDLVIGGNNIELGAEGSVTADNRGDRAASTRFAFVDGGVSPTG